MCIFTLAVRPTVDAYNAPFVFASEPRVLQLMETLTKKTIQELVMGLEAFCVSGINGKLSVAHTIT